MIGTVSTQDYALTLPRPSSPVASLRTALQQPLLVYQQIVESAEEGIWLVDQQWHTTYVNQGLADMLGWAPADMLGRPITDFMDAEGQQLAHALMHRREAGIRETHEFRFVRSDGSDLWVYLATNPLLDEHGAFVGSVAMLSDITTRKQMEAALLTHEANLLAVLENNTDYIWAVDRNYCLILGNAAFHRRFETIFQHTIQPGESVFADYIPPEVCAEWKALYDRGLAGEHFSVECLSQLSPQSRYMDYYFYPIRNTNGEITGVAVSERDITEHKRSSALMEARLRMTAYAANHTLDELLRAMIDEAEGLTDSAIGFFHFVDNDQQTLTLQSWSTNTVQHMCTAGGAGLHYSVNEAGLWAECIRQQRSMIVNEIPYAGQRQGWPPGHAPVTRMMTTPIMRNALVVGVLGVGNREIDYEATDLDTLTLLADSFWETVQAKRAEEALLAAHAALEQRVEERTAELRAVNAELAQALRVKDEFLANMSHELRTPLNTIITLAEVLTEQIHGSLNARQARAAELIGESGRRLLELINAVLDLSRIEAGIFELNIDPVDVNSICELSLRFVREMALQKSQRLQFIPAQPSITMQADARRLKQVLINLLTNAAKFTPESGAICLEVQPDEARQVVRFIVTDTGIGVPAAAREEIFRPFYQVESGLARHYEGAGLGLTLVKRLVELHGGRVEVFSEGIDGQGSRFVVTLPWTS